MEVGEFIRQTLDQINSGIRDAQSGANGENINAVIENGSANKELGGQLINRGRHGVYTRVDFDIAISAENSGKGGVKVSAFGQGLEAGGGRTSSTASRVTFSVLLRLPEGGKVESSPPRTRRK